MSGIPTVEKCTVAEDGQCAMHGVEVERRKNSQREINDIKEDIKSNRKHVGELLTFMNNFNGQRQVVAGVALVIILGSYYYTFITAGRHERVAEAQEITYQRDVQDIRRQLGGLDTRIAVTDERYRSVMVQLKMLNDDLSQLLGILNEERSVKKVRLQRDPP